MKQYPEYKDSGIKWIGRIPLEWDIKKLKFLIDGKLTYGANEVAEEINDENPRYIRITDFDNDGRLRDDTFKSLPFDLAKDYLLKEGDVLFARSGATVGKTFQFKNFYGMACFAGYLIKATPHNSKLDSDYLYFFTKSSIYENWKGSIYIQATIQNIGADKYSFLPIPLPSIHQQKIISLFLNQKIRQIDDLIEKKHKLIELLKEERTALINQAVTKGSDTTVPMRDSGINWLGEIPEHWEIKKLSYLTNRIGDGIHTTPEYVEKSEYAFINGNNLANGSIVFGESARYVQESEFVKHQRPLNDRTLLMSINGTIGNLAFYRNEKVILGKSAAYINCKELINSTLTDSISSCNGG